MEELSKFKSASLLLVAMPGAPSSVRVPSKFWMASGKAPGISTPEPLSPLFPFHSLQEKRCWRLFRRLKVSICGQVTRCCARCSLKVWLSGPRPKFKEQLPLSVTTKGSCSNFLPVCSASHKNETLDDSHRCVQCDIKGNNAQLHVNSSWHHPCKHHGKF